MNEDSFASYLAKHYIGRKGFQPGTVPEAEPLAQVCDIVLTQADGMSFQVVCIVDREKNPQKTFAMPLDALLEIGQRCLKYTGKVSGQQMPVTLQIVEVGPGPGSPQDRQRLGALKRKSAFGKVVPIAWRLDTTAGRAWTNAPLGGLHCGEHGEKRDGERRETLTANGELRRLEVLVGEARAAHQILHCALAHEQAAERGVRPRPAGGRVEAPGDRDHFAEGRLPLQCAEALPDLRRAGPGADLDDLERHRHLLAAHLAGVLQE